MVFEKGVRILGSWNVGGTEKGGGCGYGEWGEGEGIERTDQQVLRGRSP